MMPPDRKGTGGPALHYRPIKPGGGDDRMKRMLEKTEDEKILDEILGSQLHGFSPHLQATASSSSDTPNSTQSFDSFSEAVGSASLPLRPRTSSQSPYYYRRVGGSPALSQPEGSIKKRRRLLPEETDLLVKVFDRCPRPNNDVRDQLSERLGMSPRAIQIWFQNRRAKTKRDLQDSERSMLLFNPTKAVDESRHSLVPMKQMQKQPALAMDEYENLFNVESNLPDLFSTTDYEPTPMNPYSDLRNQPAVWEQGVWYEDMSFLPNAITDQPVVKETNHGKELDIPSGMDFLL